MKTIKLIIKVIFQIIILILN